MKGWYGNKMGHSLASRGIKTRRKDLHVDVLVDYDKREKIEKLFSEMVRENMSNEQFWEWVADWKDVDDLMRESENWDIDTKIDDLYHYLEYEADQNDEWVKKAKEIIFESKTKADGVKRMSANKWVRSFDTSTEAGIEEAEKFKEIVENKFDSVETKIIGVDEVLITGQNITIKDKKPIVHEKEHLGFHRDEVMHNAYMKAMDNISGRGGDSKKEIAFEMRNVLRNNGYEEYVELV